MLITLCIEVPKLNLYENTHYFIFNNILSVNVQALYVDSLIELICNQQIIMISNISEALKRFIPFQTPSITWGQTETNM